MRRGLERKVQKIMTDDMRIVIRQNDDAAMSHPDIDFSKITSAMKHGNLSIERVTDFVKQAADSYKVIAADGGDGKLFVPDRYGHNDKVKTDGMARDIVFENAVNYILSDTPDVQRDMICGSLDVPNMKEMFPGRPLSDLQDMNIGAFKSFVLGFNEKDVAELKSFSVEVGKKTQALEKRQSISNKYDLDRDEDEHAGDKYYDNYEIPDDRCDFGD